MCITEYDEERFANEQREEGKAECKAEGILITLIGLVKKEILTLENKAATRM